MNKLLGIVVLSLLWCNISTSKDYVLESKIPIGSDKKLMCKISSFDRKGTSISKANLFCHSFWEKHYIYFPKYKTEIINEGTSDVHFVYENVNKRMKCTNVFCRKGDGTLKKIAYSKDEAMAIANPEYAKVYEEKKKIAEKPKKQEPAEGFDSLDLKATLIYWGLKLQNLQFTFNDRNSQGVQTGRLTVKQKDTTIDAFPNLYADQYNIYWQADSFNSFSYSIEDPKYTGGQKSFQVSLNFNKMLATISSSNGQELQEKFTKPEKLFAKKEFKKQDPKKKKPISTPDDDKIVPAGSGSGFFVSKDGHAITNYHVIEGCDINKLSFKGSQTEVKVLAVDKVNDIAILKSNLKPEEIFPVSNEDVSLLEDVIVAGFPLGKQISSAIKTHKGVVTALAGAGDNYSFFQTDAAINQGNSGGPIINQKGNVVGIAVATWVEEGVQGVHFGIKSSTLKTFASANGLSFASPNYRELSNKDLGKLITKGTIYVECHMTIAKIKKMIAQAENRKAFFKEFR
ncbi:serine protease [Candidatus Pelagibacter sp.]|nr:serine protease [Candidatus Pelagibacter sp.]